MGSLFHMDAKSRRPKYIIAGFNKTGTKSLGDAFKQLGFRVFDAKETYSIMCEHWCDFFRGKITIEDVAKIYEKEGADVLIDVPCNFFWREFKRVWPDAKVILTVRDNVDVWYRSFQGFFEGLHRWPLFRYGWFLMYLSPLGIRSHKYLTVPAFQAQFGTTKPHTSYFDMKNPSVKHIITTRYEAHNEHVKKYCPAEDLLIINVKEGWAPLCSFLEIAVREGPLPHLNQSGSKDETQMYISEMMSDYTRACKREIIASLLLILVVI